MIKVVWANLRLILQNITSKTKRKYKCFDILFMLISLFMAGSQHQRFHSLLNGVGQKHYYNIIPLTELFTKWNLSTRKDTSS